MFYAFRGVTSQMRIFRARAIEFLDTVWERSEKRLLFPILERHTDLLVSGLKMFGMKRASRDEALGELLSGQDLWLAACAANLAATEGLHSYRDRIAQLAGSDHPTLRETAGAAVAELSRREENE
jgi:hypothetical protein